MKKNLEIRNIVTEIRSVEEESRKISGLAIPAESRSELLGGEFYETISKDALTEDLINSNDIKLYLNHDMSQGTYGRSKYGKGSLRLFITDRGLEFETECPRTAFGDALLEGIRRGDFDSLSFAFIPDKQDWAENEDGTYDRTIRSIELVDEISILSMAPAYEQTEVNLRSLEEFKEKQLADKVKEAAERIEREEREREDRERQILESLDAKLREIDKIKSDFKL